LPQFQIEIDGRVVHYVHVRGVDQESAALVLTHGWPGSSSRCTRSSRC
jgi:hypothetical protein